MSKRLLILIFLSVSALRADTIAVTNVNVIPMTSDKVLERQTVIVEGDRIVSVGTSKAPDGATVIDGTGKYLIPGLADMHGHIPPPTAPSYLTDDILFELVANGVTTLRGMGGHRGQLELRDKAKRNEIVAPTLYLAGPVFSGQTVKTIQDIEMQVHQQKEEGWDLLKVLPGLTLDQYDALARAARAQRMRFGGHLPEGVTVLHAIEMGQETFEHMEGFVEYLQDDKGALDRKKLADTIKRIKKAGAWVVPTEALWDILLDGVDLKTLREYPELKYVPQQSVDTWTRMYNERLKQTPPEVFEMIVANRLRLIKAFSDAGVKILAGTDSPQQFWVPGFSLHRELQRLHAAGMTPYQVLACATRSAGEYFKESDAFGTIERGKRADLVLLSANPLADIANTQAIEGVMLRGKWIPRAGMEERLGRIEARYKRQ